MFKLFRVLLYAVQKQNFLKSPEICVTILDARLFCCALFHCNIYEMKPVIFEMFKTFSRYLGKRAELPETYLGLVLTGLCSVDSTCSRKESKGFCSA